MAKKRTRAYTLKDLQGIVEQLGGRLQLEILPVELARVHGKLVKKCDFCDATQSPVSDLIQSPNGYVHICGTCVATCVTILAEAQAVDAVAAPSAEGKAPQCAHDRSSSTSRLPEPRT